MDKSSSYLSSDFIKEIIVKNTLFNYIPSFLTSFLQVLDVYINAPFKKSLKSKFILYSGDNNNDQVTKEKLIEWIVKSWEDNSIITKELI